MKQILSILITIIFLSGQIGIHTATHFCGGEISDQSLGIFKADLGCGMENDEPSTCDNDNSLKEASCCNDLVVSLKVKDSFKSQTKELKFDTSVAILVDRTLDLFNGGSDYSIEFISYIPPPLIKDIPVLIQSFLI